MFEYLVAVTAKGTSHTFRFGGGPLEDPKDKHIPLFFALGLLASTWARFEQHIDAVLVQVNKKNQSLYDPNHPVSFSKKLKLLKKYCNQHPALSAHKKSMREMAPKFKELSKARNEFLHAIVEDYDVEKRVIDFNGARFQGDDMFHFTQWKTNVEGIVSLANTIAKANRALYEISSQIFTVDALKQLRKGARPTRRRTTRPSRAHGG